MYIFLIWGATSLSHVLKPTILFLALIKYVITLLCLCMPSYLTGQRMLNFLKIYRKFTKIICKPILIILFSWKRANFFFAQNKVAWYKDVSKLEVTELYFQQNIHIISWEESVYWVWVVAMKVLYLFIYSCIYVFICCLFNNTQYLRLCSTEL